MEQQQVLSLEPGYLVTAFEYGEHLFTEHQQLVFTTYKKLGFVSQAQYPDEKVLDEYDNENTRYYALEDGSSGELVGTFRLVRPLPGKGLPLHHVYPELLVDPESLTCESTRVVSARRQPMRAGPHLTKNVLFEAVVRSVAYTKREELKNLMSLGTPTILCWINKTFSNVQEQIGEERYHDGGIVIPCQINVERFEQHTRKYVPHIWEYYVSTLNS